MSKYINIQMHPNYGRLKKAILCFMGCDCIIDAMDFLMTHPGYTNWKDKFLLYLFINTYEMEALGLVMPGENT